MLDKPLSLRMNFIRDGKTSSDTQGLNGLCLHRPPCLPQDPLPSLGTSCPLEAQQVLMLRVNSKCCSFPGQGFLKLLGVGILVVWGTACIPDMGHR